MPSHIGSKVPTTEHQGMLFDRLTHPNFDPIQYLNDTLPTLALSSQAPANSKQNKAVQLQNVSVETLNFLAQLNTHNIRSSSELTTLTDEILRSANRLAYEVEILRGDANNLYDILTDNLKDDIAQFFIGGASVEPTATLEQRRDAANEAQATGLAEEQTAQRHEPDFIRHLHMLSLLKTRLEAVISIFGEAMKWPVAPSEVSGTSSLISVSAPELGVVSTAEDDKAREYTRQLRSEIIEVLDSDGGGVEGLQAAIHKVNRIKRLVEVWKDTSEEKARIRVVENLSRVVEDRKKVLQSRATSSRVGVEGSVQRSSSIPGRAGRIVEGSTNTAAGLFRKLRDEMYLE